MESETNYLSQLDDFILISICSYLGSKDLLNLGLVNK
jgi:hypothetical protein